MASKISSDFPYLVPISLPIPKYVCPLGSASLPTLSILHSSRRVLTPPCFQLTFIFVSDQTAIGTWAREPKEYQMARRNATISSLPTQKCRSSRFHLLTASLQMFRMRRCSRFSRYTTFGQWRYRAVRHLAPLHGRAHGPQAPAATPRPEMEDSGSPPFFFSGPIRFGFEQKHNKM